MSKRGRDSHSIKAVNLAGNPPNKGKAMKIAILKSSVIRQVKYDEIQKMLEVTLNSGSKYRYFYVPYRIYMGLTTAKSPGRFYNAWIKGRFASLRVS